MKIKSTILGLLLLIAVATLAFTSANKFDDDSGMVSYIVDPKIQELHFYWKNKEGERLGSINRLKKEIERKNQTLVFATNGGMYSKNFSPQGLFIQNRKIITPLDTADGAGNFYMKPNGIFYITTENVPFVCETRDFIHDNNIKYATQSGPMLLLNGKVHTAFKEGSTNLNIRNGVGILPNNTILFAMSKEKVTCMILLAISSGWAVKMPCILTGMYPEPICQKKNGCRPTEILG